MITYQFKFAGKIWSVICCIANMTTAGKKTGATHKGLDVAP
jgi:hypothetical protein